MTIQLWTGREPAGYEADALRKLVAELGKAKVTAHIFANFQVGGHEIDALVVKPDGMFLVELKKVGGPVTGAVNGEWKVLNGGSEYLLAGGCGENPYQQMRTQYRVLTEWLEAHKLNFLPPYSANVTRFRPRNYRERTAPKVQIRSFLTFYPQLPPDSFLNIDWPIEAVSFPELPELLRQTTKQVHLTDGEIVAMAEALHLTRWEERSAPPPPNRRLPQPVVPLWLPPRGVSVQNAWQQVVLFVVSFLAERLTAYRERLLLQLQQTTPPQPQPVALAAQTAT